MPPCENPAAPRGPISSDRGPGPSPPPRRPPERSGRRTQPPHDPVRLPAPAPDDPGHLDNRDGDLLHDPICPGWALHGGEGGHTRDPEEPRGPLRHEQAALPAIHRLHVE